MPELNNSTTVTFLFANNFTNYTDLIPKTESANKVNFVKNITNVYVYAMAQTSSSVECYGAFFGSPLKYLLLSC